MRNKNDPSRSRAGSAVVDIYVYVNRHIDVDVCIVANMPPCALPLRLLGTGSFWALGPQVQMGPKSHSEPRGPKRKAHGGMFALAH